MTIDLPKEISDPIEKYLNSGELQYTPPEMTMCWRLQLPAEGVAFSSLLEFIKVFNQSRFTKGITPSLNVLENKLQDLYLTSLELGVENKQLCIFFMAVRLDKDWDIGPLTLSRPTIGLGYLPLAEMAASIEPQAYGALEATLAIGGVEILISATMPELQFTGKLTEGEIPLTTLLERFLPPMSRLPDLYVTDLEVTVDLHTNHWEMYCALRGNWAFGKNQSLVIQNLYISFEYQKEQNQEKRISGGIVGSIEIAGQMLNLSADHPDRATGWQLHGEWEPDNPVKIQQIADSLQMDSDELGPLAELLDLGIDYLSIDFNTATKDFSISCVVILIDGQSEEDLPAATLTLDFNLTHPINGSATIFFSGIIFVHDLHFELIFSKDKQSTALVGLYTNPGGGPNLIQTLVSALGGDDLTELSNLQFQIKSALLSYEKDNIIAHSTPPAKKSGANLLFALDMDAGLDLAGLGNLPLVGQAFAKEETIKVAFTPAFATKPWTADQLNSIKGLLPLGAPMVPDEPLEANRLVLTTTIQIPGRPPELLDLKLRDDTPTQNPGLGSSTSPAIPPAMPPIAPPGVKWVDVNKSLAGIVHLNRVGIGYANGELILLLDAAISIAGLSLGLYGLGASYNLTSHELKFMLQGIGLDLSRPPMTISSAFMNFNGDFVGRAVLQMEQFGLTALGAFTTKLGPPSMFIYGFLNYPIGGPVFFFVEGLAAGFGFNRRLTIPDISVIDQFPLVREAIDAASGAHGPAGPTEMASAQDIQARIEAELIQLATYIAPSLGEYWLAAGLKFNSFRLVDVFALLAVTFNANTYRMLISLLGVATIRIPPESPDLLANLQLNIKATLDPLEGTLLAQAEINRSSWILSPDCQLQGGFACGLWFLGEHAGDFVYTFGGYHPDFKIPAYYPRVPRLGFTWSLSSAISVKGSLYYAITPNALMAGGSMQATWHSGDLKAWFSFAADFLIQFKPFHYDARASIEIGASYEKAWITVSGHVGADLHIWGPDFSGSAHFKFGPVHFKVDFGEAAEAGPRPISWAEFKKSFLPIQTDPKAKGIATVTISNGLVATVKGPDSADVAVINPSSFVLQASTVIPITKLFAGQNNEPIEPSDSESQNFGVAPMNQTTPIDSVLLATIWLKTNDEVDVTKEFNLEPTIKKFPAGLWGKGFQDVNSSGTVNAPGGLTIAPRDPKAPGGTSTMARSSLDYDINHSDVHRQSDPGRIYAPWRYRRAADMKKDRDRLQESLSSNNVTPTAALASLPHDLLQELDLDPNRDIRLSNDLAIAFIIPPQMTPDV